MQLASMKKKIKKEKLCKPALVSKTKTIVITKEISLKLVYNPTHNNNFVIV
jgi:hypothetical protein